MGSGKFRIVRVPEVLRNDVECFILNRFIGESRVAIKTLPSAVPGIVFHHNEGRSAIEQIKTHTGRRFCPPTLFLHGPGRESSVMNFGKGSYTVMQVILKPQALKTLLGINALMMQNTAVELNEFSCEDLNQQLMDAPTAQRRVALLTQFLVDKLKQENRRDELVEESLRLIHHHAGRITVKALLEYLDLSERQFERRFSETVGISPLTYIRVRRFNEALQMMRSGQYHTLTEIAHALNFHDQSHFIRDIKAFTGIPPKSLSQKVGAFSHNQAGYSYV